MGLEPIITEVTTRRLNLFGYRHHLKLAMSAGLGVLFESGVHLIEFDDIDFLGGVKHFVADLNPRFAATNTDVNEVFCRIDFALMFLAVVVVLPEGENVARVPEVDTLAFGASHEV